jgi:cysteine desulfurase
VDAVQAPGKVSDWDQLLEGLDAYTYSAHKLGGLKGIGWSFVSKKVRIEPLILGGGQQEGARSGTENVMGAWALKLALDDLKAIFQARAQITVITELRAHLDECLKHKGHRIAAGARELNLNTALFVLDQLPADMSLPLFDLRGLELSAGSACASGTAKASHVLEALGEHSRARHGLRLSISWSFSAEELQLLKARLTQVFEKIPSKAKLF